jgi:hypothetical protein
MNHDWLSLKHAVQGPFWGKFAAPNFFLFIGHTDGARSIRIGQTDGGAHFSRSSLMNSPAVAGISAPYKFHSPTLRLVNDYTTILRSNRSCCRTSLEPCVLRQLHSLVMHRYHSSQLRLQ